MEGPAQTGEGYQTAAPASTAATGNSAVSGRSVYLTECLWQFVYVMRLGAGVQRDENVSHPVNVS